MWLLDFLWTALGFFGLFLLCLVTIFVIEVGLYGYFLITSGPEDDEWN